MTDDSTQPMTPDEIIASICRTLAESGYPEKTRTWIVSAVAGNVGKAVEVCVPRRGPIVGFTAGPQDDRFEHTLVYADGSEQTYGYGTVGGRR